MIEAEITCDCPQIQLADLQLTLTKGMTVYLDATRARASADLKRAWRARGVTVKYVTRVRKQRIEPMGTPTNPVFPPPLGISPESVTPSGPIEVLIDYEVLAQQVSDILFPKIQAILSQAVAEIKSSLPKTIMAVVSPETVMAPGKVPDDVPVFIPSKIGRDDLKAALVVAGEASSGDVSDAASALKAARKPR